MHGDRETSSDGKRECVFVLACEDADVFEGVSRALGIPVEAVLQGRYTTPAGQDPNFPQPDIQVPPAIVPANTSPQLPPVPQQAGGMTGIETSTPADNLVQVSPQ